MSPSSHGQGEATRLYGFFTPTLAISSLFLRGPNQTWRTNFLEGVTMDLVFAAIGLALWGLMVLTVWGLKKLEKPQGGRS